MPPHCPVYCSARRSPCLATVLRTPASGPRLPDRRTDSYMAVGDGPRTAHATDPSWHSSGGAADKSLSDIEFDPRRNPSPAEQVTQHLHSSAKASYFYIQLPARAAKAPLAKGRLSRKHEHRGGTKLRQAERLRLRVSDASVYASAVVMPPERLKPNVLLTRSELMLD